MKIYLNCLALATLAIVTEINGNDCNGPEGPEKIQVQSELLCAITCSQSNTCSSYKFDSNKVLNCQLLNQFIDNFVAEKIHLESTQKFRLHLKGLNLDSSVFAKPPDNYDVKTQANLQNYNHELKIDSVNVTRYIYHVNDKTQDNVWADKW